MHSLREATAADVPVIFDLICELAEYEKLRDHVDATADGLHGALFGPHRYAEVLMAESDGTIAGFALFFHNFSTFRGKPGVYLEDLFVRPPFRRLGIGRALLQRLAQIAVERGCSRLEWAVLDWNESAIEFYRKLGARPMNDWTVMRLTDTALTGLAGG
jgi:GNAT superfamily N-acetyltransferase